MDRFAVDRRYICSQARIQSERVQLVIAIAKQSLEQLVEQEILNNLSNSAKNLHKENDGLIMSIWSCVYIAYCLMEYLLVSKSEGKRQKNERKHTSGDLEAKTAKNTTEKFSFLQSCQTRRSWFTTSVGFSHKAD